MRNGLIAEIDSILAERQTRRPVWSGDPAPINPLNWPPAADRTGANSCS